MHSRIVWPPSNQKEAGSIGPVNRPSDSAVAEPKPARSVGSRAVDRVGDAFTFRPDRVTVIRPAARWPHLDFRELWHYRELLGRFVWRDVKVRYKQTLHRRRLGDPAAVPDDGRVHVRLRPVRQVPVRRPCRIRCSSTPAAALVDLLRVRGRRARAPASSRTSPLVTKVYFPRVLLPARRRAACRSSTSSSRPSCSSV